MTLCKICGKGERLGGHDPITWISNQTVPPHKYEADMRDTFGDRYVANRHREGSY